MNNREFRLGNLLQAEDGTIVEVIALWGNGNFEVHSHDFQFTIIDPSDDIVSGIELSDDLVKLFGFELKAAHNGDGDEMDYWHLESEDDFGVKLDMAYQPIEAGSTNNVLDYELKFAHQLQNYVFMFHNIELEIPEL